LFLAGYDTIDLLSDGGFFIHFIIINLLFKLIHSVNKVRVIGVDIAQFNFYQILDHLVGWHETIIEDLFHDLKNFEIEILKAV